MLIRDPTKHVDIPPKTNSCFTWDFCLFVKRKFHHLNQPLKFVMRTRRHCSSSGAVIMSSWRYSCNPGPGPLTKTKNRTRDGLQPSWQHAWQQGHHYQLLVWIIKQKWNHHEFKWYITKIIQWHSSGILIFPTPSMHYYKGNRSKSPCIPIVWSHPKICKDPC